MKERPILFSAPMVRAILRDARPKWQTRRVIQHQPIHDRYGYTHRYNGKGITGVYHSAEACAKALVRNFCPYGVPGDRLWVKETWTGTFHGDCFHIAYAADGSERFASAPPGYVLPKSALKPRNWVTPLFMPRWASRITLEIAEVRVQRVQEISYADVIAEGLTEWLTDEQQTDAEHKHFAKEAFGELWDSINATRGFGWESNPWVWAVSFRRVA